MDSLRKAKSEGKNWLADLETKEREKTGIKNLRIRYNKVFGYYLEVTNSFKDLVPDYYTRKQTLANAERYIIPELKELEDTILGAEEKYYRSRVNQDTENSKGSCKAGCDSFSCTGCRAQQLCTAKDQ